MFKKYSLKSYNFRLIALVVVTSIFGLIIINSADSSYTLRQALGITAAIIWMIVLSFIDFNRLLKAYRVWYIIAIISLVLVPIVGISAGGAQRWLGTASLRLQPSELSKILLVLFLAQFIALNKSRIDTWRFLLLTGIFIIIPLVLVIIEPDLSQTVLLGLILFTVLFCSGIPYKKIGIVLAIVVPIVVIFLLLIQNPAIGQKILKPYQWLRVMAFLDPENYDNTVYQQRNAVRAIGSGGLTGKGLNNDDPTSLLNADLIPEAHTDFVFAALGEQLGFVGSVIAIGLLAAIVFECVLVAIRTRDLAGRLVAIGISAHVALQTVFNIGVVTQLLPNTGLALPFFSYGLSSLITLYTAMGIVLNISLQREPHREKDIYTKDFVDVKEYRKRHRRSARARY